MCRYRYGYVKGHILTKTLNVTSKVIVVLSAMMNSEHIAMFLFLSDLLSLVNLTQLSIDTPK